MPIRLPGGRKCSTPAERRQFVQQNQRKPCSARGCTKRRHWTGKWCPTHAWRMRHHGHEHGLILDKDLVLVYRKKMAAFLEAYHDIAQVKAAVAVMDKLLSGRMLPKKSYAQRELRRLRETPFGQMTVSAMLTAESVTAREAVDSGSGLTPLEALEIVGAIYLLSLYRPDTLPDDRRLTFALATWLYKARPMVYRRKRCEKSGRTYNYFAEPNSGAREDVGSLVRKHLAVFMHHVFNRIEDDYRAEVRRKMALKEPITSGVSMPPLPTPSSTPTNH